MVVAVTVTLIIAATGVSYDLISRHYTLKSARAVMRFNSESILGGIDKLMMNRNNESVLELVRELSKGSAVYREVRLVSHRSGEVIVSRLNGAGTKLSIDSPSCAICHARVDPASGLDQPLDEVVDGPDGTRILHVITPIENGPGCKTADCHAHANSGPILGFLHADYSLGEIDALISGLNSTVILSALAAVLIGTLALWIIFNRTMSRPIRYLLGGIQKLAANDLSFRFKTDRKDEVGVVARSFNAMTARIQAHQDELREAMEYLEGIVENSADTIITVNPAGLIQTVNRGAEQTLGYKREELIGQPVTTLFADPKDREIAIGQLQERDNVVNYETRLLRKNGEVREVLLTLSRLRDREGNPLGTFGISKDMTNEKNLQRRLMESEKAAAIGGAVTAIQHAIKNMLNTLTGGAYLARHGIETEDPQITDDGFAMIREGISRIGDLSQKMLKYAKEWQLEPQDTDLFKLASELCDSVRQAANARDVALTCTAAEDLPGVPCDPRLVHMALMDIVTNALDACAVKRYDVNEKADVVVKLYREEDNGFVAIEVEDNGVGMSDAVKANIFTPFYSTKDEGGTGLGLAFTKRIIFLHGGDIDVESEPGKGSTIRIRLPLEGEHTNKGVENE
jgi:PAS domain S-box-containing protein